MVNEYTISVMTCDHCVARVTEQLKVLEGVERVTVDLSTGIATVESTREVPMGAVAAAIAEAGYALVR